MRKAFRQQKKGQLHIVNIKCSCFYFGQWFHATCVCVFGSIIALYYSNIGKTKRKKTLQKRNNISIHTDSMPSSNSCIINLH